MRFKDLILLFALGLFLMNCKQEESSIAQKLQAEVKNPENHVYVIERNIPGAGALSSSELKAISKASCNVLQDMEAEQISWLHSYVTDNKVYCVYSATSEASIKKHAEAGGFPANSIQKVGEVISPATAEME